MGLFDMFRGLSPRPRCPITQDDVRWVENSFAWFGEQLGTDIVRTRPVILPDPDFFPNVYQPDMDGVEDLLVRVCRYMDVDRGSVILEIFSQDEIPQFGFGHWQSEGTAGHMGWDDSTRRWTIGLREDLIPDPMSIVAVMAHEVAHVHLFATGRVDPEVEEDHEPLTDLLTIYYGFGVFTGNEAFRSGQVDYGTTSTYRARRVGYLPEPIIGYALALTALAKQQAEPPWIEHLAYGVRKPFEKSLAYLLDQRKRELDSLVG